MLYIQRPNVRNTGAVLEVLPSIDCAIGIKLYPQYVHHTIRILFRHLIEPVSGYELEIIDTKNDSLETKRAKIMLQMQDAIALSYGIQGVLSNSLIGG